MTPSRPDWPSVRPWAIAAAIPVLLLCVAWISGAFFLAVSGAASIKSASPLTLYSYWYWYSENPKIELWLYVSAFVGLFLLILPTVPFLLPDRRSLHGDAQWASAAAIRRAKLLKDDGTIVGEWRGKLLRHGNSPMVSPHVFIAAQSGGGKTEGVMIPDALTWRGSMLVLDLKQQLWDRTAGYRAKHGQQVFRLNFAPRDYRTHQYNPFSYVSRDPNFLVADVQRITNYLIQLGKGDEFWPIKARELFIGLSLYFFSRDEVPTLPKIRALALAGADGTGLQKWCKTLVADPGQLATLHPEARMSLTSFATSAENTASGIAQTVTAGLTPFLNDLTAAVVSGNSFDLRKLREEPMSIYLVVQPSDIETLSPVIRLMFQQAVDLNTDVEFGKSPRHKYRVKFGMDELVAIGPVPAIEKGIAYMRSYGLYLLALCQSDSQLSTIYKGDGAKAFADNFGAVIFYTPSAQDLAGAERLSKLLGYQTVRGKSTSRRGGLAWDDKGRSETTSDQRRALMLPQEILRMSGREAIVLISGMDPIRVRKPFAAQDRRFVTRYAPPPEVPLIQMLTPAIVAAAPAPPTRPVTAADLVVLDQLDLSDFSLDFSDIEIPKEPVSEAEINAICNQIYGRVMQPAGVSAEV
jgi:type IV secretion system protein VirD4